MSELKLKALGLDSFVLGLVVLYVLVLLVVMVVVVVRNDTNKERIGWGVLTLVAFAAVPYMLFLYRSPEQKLSDVETARLQAEIKLKYEEAKPVFDRLCKESSEPVVRRVVENVEGVLLLKTRPVGSEPYYQTIRDQFWPQAALSGELNDRDGYVEAFLVDRIWVVRDNVAPGIRYKVGSPGLQHGFSFVDVLSSPNGERIRITAIEDANATQLPMRGIRFHKAPATGQAPRYAVTFEDNVDPELRRLWIAGTTIRVIDTKTNEVIGEQSFWRWDRLFGVRDAGGPAPWERAERCPRRELNSETHRFVDRILKATQRN